MTDYYEVTLTADLIRFYPWDKLLGLASEEAIRVGQKNGFFPMPPRITENEWGDVTVSFPVMKIPAMKAKP